MQSISHNSERFSFRLGSQKKARIERAAAALGLTLTDFATLTLLREAEQVLGAEQSIVLSDRDRDAFLAALDNPPAAARKAMQAAKRYRDARKSGALR